MARHQDVLAADHAAVSHRRGVAQAWRLERATRKALGQVRAYTREVCAAPATGLERPVKKLILAVVGGYPLLGYVRLGYDWVGAYYNPCLMFDEVHYFQTAPVWTAVLDFGYPMHVHRFRTAADVVRVCRARQVNVIRAYDPRNGATATAAGRELKLPVIVSIH